MIFAIVMEKRLFFLQLRRYFNFELYLTYPTIFVLLGLDFELFEMRNFIKVGVVCPTFWIMWGD
jgi:hypothetical protein